MRLAIAGLLAMAIVFGLYTVVGAVTKEPTMDRVLVLDGSASFAGEVEKCPQQLADTVQRAVRDRDRLLIASFARDALGRPWAHDVDYEQALEQARDDGEVEVATEDEWERERISEAERTLEATALRAIQKGSALLEQLERISLTLDDRKDRELEIVICSDGEIVDEGVDVRKDFDQAAAVRLWRPRLDGLENATIRMIGFGRGMKPEEIRRSREFMAALFHEADVRDIDLDPGGES